MTRRDALSGLAAVAPAVAFGSQANSAITVGIIGTGNRGRYDGAFFAQDSRARVVALCDLYPDQIDRAKTEIPSANNAKSFSRYQDLLAEPGIDAVVITTPVYLHPEHFAAAVAAKKHIYCEKAAGASVAGVTQLMKAAAAADPSKHIQFGFQQRYSPEYLAAEQIIRSGQLGDIVLMRSHWMVGGVRPKSQQAPIPPEREARVWYPWRAKSGDMIVEQDCHGVDVMNWYSGRHPLSAVGDGGRKMRTYGDTMDHLNVTYDYGQGLHGFLHACQLAQAWGLVDEQFFGSEGTLETHRRYYRWSRPNQNPLKVESKREITIDAIERFLTRIAENKPENNAKDAAESTLSSLLGRMAIDTGRRVTWEELLKSE
ncbi:MAG TPA: Gfo/Idh/MocA family oxidoreductase [Bryobacteraceae bacterium]|nr:Gfo/Idh/MocA family oxidoreductase [Bryobacteraceae bacterium]